MIRGAGAPLLPSSYVEFVPSSDTAPSLASDSLMRTNMLPTAQELAAPTTTAASSDHADDAPPAEERGYAGIDSRKLSAITGSTQFIDFLVPRGSGGSMANKHSGALARSVIENWQHDASGGSSFDYIAALDGAAGSAPREKYAGLTSEVIADHVVRTALDRKLQNPNVRFAKQEYARRASTSNEAAAVIYRLPEPDLVEKVERRKRLSLCLAPKVAELLYAGSGSLTETLLRQTKRPSVAEIRMLNPTKFEGAAGLSSTDLSMIGPSKTDMVLHSSFEVGRAFRPPDDEDTGKRAPPVRRASHDMRRGSEIAWLLGTVGDGIVAPTSQIASSAPESLFDGAAGMNSKEIDVAKRGAFWEKPSRAEAFGDEAKFALYGGGPKLVGTMGSLREQKNLARRASIVRTANSSVTNAYEGAAGASSKMLFFNSDWCKTPTGAAHFFSENLHFRPIGVPGLGTDAKQKRVDGAAGLSSDELFIKQYEKDGLMMDEAKTPSAAAKFDHQISDGIVYYGGSASRASGIPDANPAPFVGAAGLSSAQHAMMMSRLGDAEMMGEALNLGDEAPPMGEPTGGGGGGGAADEASGDDHLTPRRKAAIRRKSAVHKASKEGLLGDAALEHVQNRRGSMFNTEGIAIFGGPMLQRVRESARVPMSRGAAPWTGMPPSFEGAAGLSSQQKNWLERLFDPSVKEDGLGAPPAGELHHPSPQPGGGLNARRGSALHSESFAILGGDLLTELRAERVGSENQMTEIARRPKSAPAWEGMPAAFEGGAGLPSKFLQMIEMRSMPDARVAGEEGPPPPRSKDPSRPPSPRASPAFHGAAGLTSDEVADRKGLLGFKEGQRRPMVGGHEAGDVIYGRADSPSARRSPAAWVGGGAAAAEAEDEEPRIYEIPEAYPSSYVGAAGLTSSEVAVSRGRGLGLERAAASRLPQEEIDAIRLAAADEQARLDPTGRPSVYGAGGGDLSGRGGMPSPYYASPRNRLAARAAPGLAEAGISTRDGATPHVATAGVSA